MANEAYRILALDIDGTLLARDGTLRPRTIAAVCAASARGIVPVLCTGRRYRRASPIAERLGIDTPLVCNSGALVKSPDRHETLWRADLDPAVLSQVLALFAEHDEPAISFTDRSPLEADFRVATLATGRPLFDDYLDQNRGHADVDPGWTLRPDGSHFHLCAIGEPGAMLAFETVLHARIPGQIQTFVQRSPRYLGTMCEVLRIDANKWTALERIAALWDVDASEICAVGDDRNDVPMLLGAGLGVAMGHASAEVIAAADLVTTSDDQDGLACFIEDYLLK